MDQRIIPAGKFEIKVNLRTRESRTNGTRVYVDDALTPDVGNGPRAGDEGLTGEYRYVNGTKINAGDVLYTQHDAYPEVDRAWDRFNRGVVDAQRQVIIDALLHDVPGLIVHDTQTFAYSKYAGCTCPCSPGFVVKEDRRKSRLTLDGIPIDDVFISKAGTHQERLNQQATARAERYVKRAGDVTYTKSVRYDKLLKVLDAVAAKTLTPDDAFKELNK